MTKIGMDDLPLLRQVLLQGCGRQRVFGWNRRDLNTGIFRKDNILAAHQPAFVNGKTSRIESNAGRDVSGAHDDTYDATDEAEAVGSHCRIARQAAILIERTPGKKCQHQRYNDAVLWFGLHSAFRVDLKLLRFGCICAGECALHVLRVHARQLQFTKIETQFSCPAKKRAGLAWVMVPMSMDPCGTASVWSGLKIGSATTA